MEPKELTYDQKKAAEAAFQGLPPNPKWSVRARAVYEGIVTAMGSQSAPLAAPAKPIDTVAAYDVDELAEETAADRVPPALRDEDDELETETESEPQTRSLAVSGPPILNRDEAIQAGILIDVTPVAHEVGLRLPVGISKPLWEIGITASHQITDEDFDRRVRDVLMALRLHLETSEITSPWIKFPALLSFPPDTAPQVCSLYAVAHKDPATPYSITLLLPHELSTLK
jgi:hypothetical protein